MDQTLALEKSNRLVVRVKMNGLKQTITLEKDYTYNIKRISIAVILCSSFLAAGYYYFFASDDIQDILAFEMERPLAKDKVEAIVEAPLSLVEQPGQSVQTESMELIEPEVITVVPVDEIKPPKVVLLSEQNEVLVEETVLADESSVNAFVEPSLTPEVVEVVKTAANSSADFSANFIADFSENISRAQFTNKINKLEPVDIVEGIVPVRAEGSKQVYFFTELVDLKGQTIRHQWFYDNELKSELGFKVGGDRWRVNSSKRLSPRSTGNWEVRVVNEQGDILLSREFDYQLL